MIRLIADEFRKVRRTFLPVAVPWMFLLAPVLGVLTARANAQRDPDRIRFDFPTLFAQVQLDNGLLVAPLVLGALGIFVLLREYQEGTMGPLLLVPTKPLRLVAAKLLGLGLVALAGSIVSALATVVVALAVGSPDLDLEAIVQGSLRLVSGELMVLPSVALLMTAVVWFRNFLVAFALALGAILLGMAAVNLPEVSPFVPWLAPTVLTIDLKTLENLGFDKAELAKATAVYLLFTAATFSGLFFSMERKDGT